MEKTSSRDARRRRILNGGSDRMALIHGSIDSLPNSSSTSFSGDDLSQPNNLNRQIQGGLEDDYQGSTLPKSVNDKNESFKPMGNQDQPQVFQGDKIAELKQPLLQQEKSVVSKASTDTETPSNSSNNRRNSLTPKQYSACILSSETTRIICSLMIALLVVLSYVDRPLLGRNLVRSESIVASKPFYILLLTDITIIFARISLEKRRGAYKSKEEDEEEESAKRVPHEEEGHNWASAIKVLETGLVVYQSICAVFMDFCVYAVVVICGLSFV